MPTVTVSISTFRERYLEWVIQLIQSLETQTMNNFEVLLVVNRNQRYFKTLSEYVKMRTDIERKISVVFNPFDKGIAHSRNISLKTAHTPYVAFTDDDAIPHRQWLEKLIYTMEQSDQIGAVVGPVLANWSRDTQEFSSWFPKELYWIIGCTPWDIKEVRNVRNGFASNFLLRRETALECGGFNEKFGYNPINQMVGEEPEFGIRLRQNRRYTIWNPEAIVYHRIFRDRMNIKNILTRCFVEGKTKAYLRQMVGEEATETELTQIGLLAKAFARTKSFKSKALLITTTIAVLVGYLSRLEYVSEFSRRPYQNITALRAG